MKGVRLLWSGSARCRALYLDGTTASPADAGAPLLPRSISPKVSSSMLQAVSMSRSTRVVRLANQP
jgi:hypothetical protein